jgi:hypothetical protein
MEKESLEQRSLRQFDSLVERGNLLWRTTTPQLIHASPFDVRLPKYHPPFPALSSHLHPISFVKPPTNTSTRSSSSVPPTASQQSQSSHPLIPAAQPPQTHSQTQTLISISRISGPRTL